MDSVSIDNFKFNVLKNVKNEYIDTHTSTKRYDYYSHTIDSDLNTYYFLLFETCFDGAFGHWVFESAIFLTFFEKIKEQFIDKNVKILVKKNSGRKYKKLFFDALDIKEEDIYYIDNKIVDSSDTCYDNIPVNNCCIICNIYGLNNKKYSHDDISKYKILLLKFKKDIINNLKFDYNKKIQNLFLPRNKVENYAPNDRQVDYNKVYKLLENKQYIEYNTFETNKLKEQIQLLLSSENIYLDFGASFHVNGFFCKNSTINIIKFDNNSFKFPLLKLLYFYIKENNIINYI